MFIRLVSACTIRSFGKSLATNWKGPLKCISLNNWCQVGLMEATFSFLPMFCMVSAFSLWPPTSINLQLLARFSLSILSTCSNHLSVVWCKTLVILPIPSLFGKSSDDFLSQRLAWHIQHTIFMFVRANLLFHFASLARFFCHITWHFWHKLNITFYNYSRCKKRQKLSYFFPTWPNTGCLTSSVQIGGIEIFCPLGTSINLRYWNIFI